MIDQAAALALIAQHATGTCITPADVVLLLQNVHGVTFAQIRTVTPVKLSAANKQHKILKVGRANVQLANNLKAHTELYANAVKRSAGAIADNDQQQVAAFESSGNYFEHTNCFAVVQHKTDPSKQYLFGIYNTGEAVYVHSGQVVDKQYVAQFLTPAEAKKLLAPPAPVYNVAHDIEHNVVVRTVSLSNIVSIAACKAVLSV